MHHQQGSSGPASVALPPWTYHDAPFFERERKDIFFKSWQYAGWVGNVANAGDYLTAEILDQSVVILRTGDGELRGFHNVCQHRGHPLLEGNGRVARIVCPYHAWSYRLDGGLATARGAEKQAHFDCARFRLQSIRTEVFAGKFVFFNLDPEARPLAEIAAGLAEELAREVIDFGEMVRVDRAGPDGKREALEPRELIRANWKVVTDNCLECFHCRPTHPEFGRLVDLDTVRVRGHDYWSAKTGVLKEPSPVPADARNRKWGIWWLWPNTYFDMMPGGAHGLTVGRTLPIDPLTTVQPRGERYAAPDAPAFEPRGYGDLGLVAEDYHAMAAVQRGMASVGFDSAYFNIDPLEGETNEAPLRRFHEMVAQATGLDRT
jgi:phenylpropionate dioxygenase-like ring-hydroxylating dioxygenase large terminal subunit